MTFLRRGYSRVALSKSRASESLISPTRPVAAAPESDGKTAVKGIVAGVGAASIWSGWYVLARHGVTTEGLDAYDLAALRFLVAAPLLLAMLRSFPFRLHHAGNAVLMALGAGPAFVIVVGLGFLQAPASFGGSMTAVSGVLFTLVGARLFIGERLAPVQYLGIVVALAGLFLLASAAGGNANTGYFVAGGLLWACYGVAFRRSGLSALQAVTSVAVISAVIYLPLYFWHAGLKMLKAPTHELLLQAIGQGVFTGVVALVLHARAVACLGALKGALFQSLVPPFALVMSVLMLGEKPMPLEIASVVLVLVGVFVALKYRP